MRDEVADMIDVAYDLQGGMLPSVYAFALWRELVRALPWLEAEQLAGVLPLRASESGEQMLLPQRAKLVLRLPQHQAHQAQQLSGRTLDVDGYALQIGAARQKPLQVHPALHAQLVASAGDENEFLAEVAGRLRELEIAGKWICGRRVVLQGGEREIAGYSLVVHELQAEGSLQLQQIGLGGERRYGCGIFVPCKDIPHFD